MRAWLTQHARALAATLSRLVRAPLASALNVAVIGIALALPLGLYLVLANLQGLARAHGSTPQLSLYLALEASAADVARIEERLQQHPRVHKFVFVPRDQALRELMAGAGLADVIASLPHNPLPDAFVVDTRDGRAQMLEALRDELRQWPKVGHVQLDSTWAKRLEALLNVGRVALLVLAAALGLGMATASFNTIRLQILSQREEIEVSGLLGATDRFIQRPFLYYGALLGLGSALLAWCLVELGVHTLNHSLIEVGTLYDTTVRLRRLSPEESGSLVLFSTILCWIGAWLSVRSHLSQSAPREPR
jgi:cell division transport system permease protein